MRLTVLYGGLFFLAGAVLLLACRLFKYRDCRPGACRSGELSVASMAGLSLRPCLHARGLPFRLLWTSVAL